MENKESPHIQQAVIDFLNELAVGKQPNTVKAYTVTLNRFLQFLKEHLKDPNDILTVDHAIEFAKSLQGLAPATTRNYLAALSQFYRYLFARRLISADIADHERLFITLKQMRPRSHRLPHVPADDMISAIIQAAKRSPQTIKEGQASGDKARARLQQLRNVAFLLCLRSSGMRLGEALALRRGDLDYRNKSAIVTGKGRKERVTYFDDEAWQSILEYLQARQDGARANSLANLPLFARHDRRSGNRVFPLTRQRVEQVFADLAEQSNLDPRPTPHGFRHWFATQVLEQTQDLAALQDMLGHESPETTRIYAKVSSKRLREVHKATFGRKQAD